MNDKKFIKLTPFKMQVLQSFPFIDEDFDAITNYELLCKVVEYLNKTVINVDLLNEKVEEYNKTIEDKVIEQINALIDSGELDQIILDAFDSLNSRVQILENTEYSLAVNNETLSLNKSVIGG